MLNTFGVSAGLRLVLTGMVVVYLSAAEAVKQLFYRFAVSKARAA